MDYDQYYTIEFKGSKGWEVSHCYEGLNDALTVFRSLVLRTGDVQEYRLTTPARHSQ